MIPATTLTTFYLQMMALPAHYAQNPRPLPAGSNVMQAIQPTISFYRYLYNTVGEAYDWFDRRRLSDSQLAAIVQHPQVAVHVLYAHGVPAGYAELDWRVPGEVELAYFGLMPEFVGRGYGLSFLQWAVTQAWSQQPQRLWVHTCTLDHPNALSVYQKAGFVLYKEETTPLTGN